LFVQCFVWVSVSGISEGCMSAAQAAAGSAGVVRVLGTGGTIAGVSHTGRDRDYQAASLGVDTLVSAVPALAEVPLQCQQVCQVDSKDMGWPQWRLLLAACLEALHDPDVAGVVVTHGTDTLEETALLLQVLLPPVKPVVLTAAMRPATSVDADGPANLWLAVRCAQAWAGQARGVAVAVQGRLWPALAVRKAHSWAIDAFEGVAGMAHAEPLPWPQTPCPPSWGRMSDSLLSLASLPWVPLLTSHADVQPQLVQALMGCAPEPSGWLVATTGHGTVHEAWVSALATARQPVWRATRVARGGIAHGQAGWPSAGPLTPAQARLLLSVALAVSGPDGLDDWLAALRAEPGLSDGLMPD
jgi:L-asparaginase